MSSPQRIAASRANGKLGGGPKKQYDWKLNRTEEILSLARAGFGFKRIAATLKIRERLMLRKYLKELGIAAQPNNANHWLTSHCGTPIKELHLAAKLEREHDGWWLKAYGKPKLTQKELNRKCLLAYYANHEHNKARANERAKKQYLIWKQDPCFKVHRSTRNVIARIARMCGSRRKPRTRSFEYLGCTYDEARMHLENSFRDGMTWDNHGTHWEIDHKRPLASFDLLDEVQLHAACHFTNLQPLLKHENRSKAARRNDTKGAPPLSKATYVID